MKKFLLALALFAVIITGSLLLISCDNTENQPEPPTPPTLDKSKFEILYSTDESGVANYRLDWDAYAASKFEIVYDDSEPIIFEGMRFPLGDFSADDVHTVTVTAVSSQNLKSEPVTVKFKGTKLTMPYNVRLYGNTNSFGWMESDETQVYVISCEELDLDVQTSKPIGTGKIKTIPVYNNRLGIDTLREIYSRLELYSLESFRVQALPYNGNTKGFEYTSENDIIELQLPSDFSEQSVNFYAGEMSNPTNVRWDFEGFEDHPGYAYIKWDGALSNYKYKVMTKYPEDGHYSGIITQNGESSANFGFSSFLAGEYEVTVQAEYEGFDLIGSNANEKWITYMIYLLQPAEETLKFKIDNSKLEAPTNVRIEGENIVWDDDGKFVDYYHITLKYENSYISESSDTASLSLQDVFKHLYKAVDGEYEITVSKTPISCELISLENNVPVLKTYHASSDSEVSKNKVKLVSIPKVQNVNVDYENKTISWDANPEATSYKIGFYYKNGGGFGATVGSETEYKWPYDDYVTKYDEIVITATCEYNVTTENGVTTMYIPSEYVIDLTQETES